jgi:hypothetical protein
VRAFGDFETSQEGSTERARHNQERGQRIEDRIGRMGDLLQEGNFLSWAMFCWSCNGMDRREYIATGMIPVRRFRQLAR